MKIGYGEVITFAFNIESDTILLGKRMDIDISVFNEHYEAQINRGLDYVKEGRNGTLTIENVSGYKVKVKYKALNTFHHGEATVKFKVNGIVVREQQCDFYKNIGHCNFSQEGEYLKLVFEGVVTDIRVNKEKLTYYKRGELTFANCKFVDNPEITYREAGKTYLFNAPIEDNKKGEGLSTLIIGNHNYTASLFTGLTKGKTYNFVNDGELYELKEPYNSIGQVSGAQRLDFNEGMKVTPRNKINHYVVFKSGRYNPITILTK